MEKLKSCPWCGREPHYTNGLYIDKSEVHILFCKGTKSFKHECEVQSNTKDKAMLLWNRRTAKEGA